MTFWYINKNMIIKSNPLIINIKDKLEHTKIFDTYKEAVEALSKL